MTYLTTNGLLDSALSTIQDNSAIMRAKMLVWLNRMMQAIAYEPRDWEFLKKTATLTITSNQITLPADYARFVSVKSDVGAVNKFFLQKRDQIDDEEAFGITVAAGSPNRFAICGSTLTFYPGASGTCVLKYIQEVPTYADNATTIFPKQYALVLERGCLDFYYEYDMDERAALSAQMLVRMLSTAKTLDNKSKPLPRYSSAGYLRDLNAE